MEYLSVDEAAAALGLTVRAIRLRIQRGDMRAERIGMRVWAIPREEVERWRAIGRLKPGPKPSKASADQ
jgi:excisionase family DNA binding protein